jgi:uncharacterized membrane protein
MKSILLISAFIFIFTSCNIPKDGEQENIPTSKLEALTMLEDVEDSTKKEPTASIDSTKPILIARGSEPGWYAEFFPDHLRLIVDYGRDSLYAKMDFSKINSDRKFTSRKLGVHTNFKLDVLIETKPCTEASGEKSEKSITVHWNDKEYKGCAYSTIVTPTK